MVAESASPVVESRKSVTQSRATSRHGRTLFESLQVGNQAFQGERWGYGAGTGRAGLRITKPRRRLVPVAVTPLFDTLIMNPDDVKQIIADNRTLVNVGGHFFEGQTKHNRRSQGLPQMTDLIPFEAEGLIRRVHAVDGIGKRYVSAFESNAKCPSTGATD